MRKRLISALMIPFICAWALFKRDALAPFKQFGLLTKQLTVLVVMIWSVGFSRLSSYISVHLFGVFVFAADVIVFNLIEFWTGSNPLAMAEGEEDEQLISYNGQDYLVTARKNQFQFDKMNKNGSIESSTLTFSEEDYTWRYSDGLKEMVVATVNPNDYDKFRNDLYAKKETVPLAGLSI